MGDQRRTRLGRIAVLGVVGLALASCGVESTSIGEQPQLDAVDLPPVAAPAETQAAADPATGPVSATHTPAAAAIEAATPAVAPAPEGQDLDQPAIWPAPDVVFATPEEAAADFVSEVLVSEGDPVLGEFQQGDSRSGEIAVLFAGEDGDLDPPQERGLLALRRIGPTDGWYVIAAMSDGATIDSPSGLEAVAAGTLTVSGEGRGFEGTIVVSAFPPGDDAALFDLEISAGGAFADLEPYRADLDLSGASAGDVVVILARGDTGLGTDPGSFAAIPIVIGATAPATVPPTK